MMIPMTFKEIITDAWDTIKKTLKTLLKITLTILTFMFFVWVGIKGIIAFSAGMAIMAYLIMTENPLLQTALDMTTKKGGGAKLLKPNKILKRP